MQTTSELESILFVEDNLLLRKSILPFLKRLGFHIYTAADASEAMAVWASHSDEIQILLSDVSLPDGMSGVELAKELRMSRPEMPIILASGYIDKGDNLEIELGKGVFFIAKPFDPQALNQIVRKAQTWAREERLPAFSLPGLQQGAGGVDYS